MNSAGISNLSPSGAFASGVLDQRLSLDVQGVDALRRTVRTSPQEGMKQASRQFEVMFLQMMLKSMREATPSDSMFSTSQEKTYTSMLDQQLSQNLSGRGLGLAEAMFTQLSRTMGDAPAAGSSGQLPGVTPFGMPLLPAAATPALTRAPDLSFYEKATAQATLSRSVLPQAHVEQFVSRMLPAAQRASQASGVPAQLIMAQAALESGWGKREIRAEDGKTSFNLFGIKADKGWKGPVTVFPTHEVINGERIAIDDQFRAYRTFGECLADRAEFFRRNPRYAKCFLEDTGHGWARAVARAGYATDPTYADKLIQIMDGRNMTRFDNLKA